MMRRAAFFCLTGLVFLTMFLSGCQTSSRQSADPDEPPVYSPLKVLVPSADGTETLGYSPLVLDISNVSQGYMVAQAEPSEGKFHIQILGPDQVTYSYFTDGDTEAVIPLTGGDGEYTITAYQQISGDQYAALFAQVLDIKLDNIFLPFLYPNQYVDFTPDSEACKLAQSMLPEDATDLDGVDAIYTYVIGNITYDETKAMTVENGYLPDVDKTLETGTGICFDYAALMAAMLRSRDIPCKLQIGYSNEIKHAWIDVYIRSIGWVDQAIAFDGKDWTRMDPTFKSTSDGDEIQEYIGDGTNYTVQFSR